MVWDGLSCFLVEGGVCAGVWDTGLPGYMELAVNWGCEFLVGLWGCCFGVSRFGLIEHTCTSKQANLSIHT